jgi:hypothetical protein
MRDVLLLRESVFFTQRLRVHDSERHFVPDGNLESRSHPLTGV